MKTNQLPRFTRLAAALVLTLTFTASAQDPPTEKPASEAPKKEASPLTGTRWQLVKIKYSDGKTHTPEDKSRLTLQFLNETRVAARLDVNRGNGTWKSPEPGKLEFGPMATTRAANPPGSLGDLMAKDLPHVRSFIIKDGYLFLALEADGGTYEFEPLAKATTPNQSEPKR